MPKKTRPFSEVRQERLLIPEVAAEYLNIAKAQSQEIFLKSLRRVAQARQISKVAKEAGVQRETLYHALSETGNPTIETFGSVLSVLGLDYDVRPKNQPVPRGSGHRGKLRHTSNAIRSEHTVARSIVNIGTWKAQAAIKTARTKIAEGQAYESGRDEENSNLVSSRFDFNQQAAAAGN